MSDLFIPLSRISRVAMVAAVLFSACALGGCASSGAVSDAFAMAPGGRAPGSGPTVAFESIDGPPPQVFDRMVSVLDSEAKLRDLAIVSREGAASYRVRSYLSAQILHGKTVIAWLWDVYDADQQRALRLSGEEPTGKADGNGWTAADEVILRKIAQAGLSGLSSFINGAPTGAPAAPQGPAVATAPAADGSGVVALGYSAN
jgi:hypothetical protein